MKYRIEDRGDYLLAEVQARESAAEMRTFLTAAKDACLEHGQPKLLISVRSSRAVFKAEDYGLSGYVNQMVSPACRVALVGDSSELQHAHDYIVIVARQQGVNVRAFREVRDAARWLGSAEDREAPGGGSDLAQPGRPPKLA